MAQNGDRVENADVVVERFSRRIIRIGSFSGGFEKEVRYDTKVEKPTHERVVTRNGETVRLPEKTKVEYRKFRDADREVSRPEAGLSDLARKQTTFTVTDSDDVSYREFVGVETMYLVSWDEGATVHVMTEEELDEVIENGGLSKERGTTPTDVVANALDQLDSVESAP